MRPTIFGSKAKTRRQHRSSNASRASKTYPVKMDSAMTVGDALRSFPAKRCCTSLCRAAKSKSSCRTTAWSLATTSRSPTLVRRTSGLGLDTSGCATISSGVSTAGHGRRVRETHPPQTSNPFKLGMNSPGSSWARWICGPANIASRPGTMPTRKKIAEATNVRLAFCTC